MRKERKQVKWALAKHRQSERRPMRMPTPQSQCRSARCPPIGMRIIVGGEAALSRTEEKLVEMTNGCICCTLREDLLAEVADLATEGRFDYLLIESTGISEPAPVADSFTFAIGDGTPLSEIAELDTMVTVVDAANLFALHVETPSRSAGRDM